MSRADVSPADTERAVRIDLAAVRHNVGVLQERIRRPDGSRPLLTAVVKADAYGHGAVAVARAAAAAGADRLGVAHVREALALRAAGVRLPVLAWLHTGATDFAAAVEAEVTLGVSGWDLDAVADAVRGLRTRGGAGPEARAVLHLKADTGLGRHGCTPERWPCLLYTSPSPRDQRGSRMPSSA